MSKIPVPNRRRKCVSVVVKEVECPPTPSSTYDVRPKRKSKKSNQSEGKENRKVSLSQPVVDKKSFSKNPEPSRRHLSVVDPNKVGSTSSTGDLDDSVFGETKISPVIEDSPKSGIAESDLLQPFISPSLPPGVVNIDFEDDSMDYEAEMDAYLRERELLFVLDPDFLDQGSITPEMRSVLVDWLIQVQHYLKLSPETLHISISLLDTILSLRDVEPDKLQLLGITSLYLGSKMEEYYPADVKKLLHLTENSYIAEDVFNMELVVLGIVQFQVYVPTVIDFLGRLVRASLRSENTEFVKTCYFLADCHMTSILHPTLSPSHLAAAAVFAANLLLYVSANPKGDVKEDLDTLWTPSFGYYSKSTVTEVLPTSLSMIYKITSTKLTGARNKYQSKSQHGRLACAPHFHTKVLEKSVALLKTLLKNELPEA